MAVMGIVAAQAKAVTKEEAKALLARPVTEFYDNKKEKIEYGYKFWQGGFQPFALWNP